MYYNDKISYLYGLKANSGRYSRRQRRVDAYIYQTRGIRTILYRVTVPIYYTVCVADCAGVDDMWA